MKLGPPLTRFTAKLAPIPICGGILLAMVAPPKDARSALAELIAIETLPGDGALITVRPSAGLGPLAPNRFFMLRREDGLSPRIPRPFSIYREAYREDGPPDLVFMIKVIGDGTRALVNSSVGEKLRLIGPLGKGWPNFTEPADVTPWVFLAGGIGSAPFFMAIEAISKAVELAELNGEPAPTPAPFMLYGAGTRDLVYDAEAFSELDCALHVATDDGSFGFKGNVVTLLKKLQADGNVPKKVRIAACGPTPMLRAVERFANENNLECYVSLEDLMGCGVGICNGCVVETKPDGPMGAWPNAKSCVEGPAFNTNAVFI
jgi:dihydroorotate dehydrogenase electron transfer subunit